MSGINQGSVLGGKYRLLRQIGEGSMGTVWAARNEVTLGDVAIKILNRVEPELRQRTEREARVGAVLKHRFVLDVYDLGETEGGQPFLVMQLLSGETLGDRLKRVRRLAAPVAAQVARDVAKALAAAHSFSIVHRDLKPANIFMHVEPGEETPVVKVLDFGVARHLHASDGIHTALGTLVGTPHYMSPEQVRTEPNVDHRADIWALGVVLFEMLTGNRPFQGDVAQVLSTVLVGEIPSVTRYVRRVDEGLANIVSRCLRRKREERYQSAAEVAKLLEAFAGVDDSTQRGSMASVPSLPDATAVLPPSENRVQSENQQPLVQELVSRDAVSSLAKVDVKEASKSDEEDVAVQSNGDARSTLSTVAVEKAADKPEKEESARASRQGEVGKRKVVGKVVTAAVVVGCLGGAGLLYKQMWSRQASEVASVPEQSVAERVSPSEEQSPAPVQSQAPQVATAEVESAVKAPVVDPTAEPQPTSTGVERSPERIEKSGEKKDEKDPCAEKTGFLLTNCLKERIEEDRKRIEEEKKKRADAVYNSEDKPTETPYE